MPLAATCQELVLQKSYFDEMSGKASPNCMESDYFEVSEKY